MSDRGWERVEAAGVRAEVIEPLSRWRLGFDGDGAGFELEFRALSEPLAAESGGGPGRARGRHGGLRAALPRRGHRHGRRVHEQARLPRPARARVGRPRLGLDRAGAHGRRVAGRGSRGRARGDPPGGRARPRRRRGARVPGRGGGRGRRGGGPRGGRPAPVDDLRRRGRQRRAGLELWIDDEDELPRRAAGEALCGTSLELGRLQLDCAFFAWTMEGRAGVGPYEVVRWR